jgi:hypothetical protein
MTESNIILAIIGSIGLLTTFAVYSRANRVTDRYYKATKINQDLIKLNEEMFN